MDFATSQAGFAAALTDPAAPLPAGVTTARGEPDAARFAVYRNNVAVGLIKALEAKFPTVRRLVGDEFFRGMASTYCTASKPKSPLIFEYGDDFPAFVAAFQPATSVPYLADVARIETAWMRAYHAQDTLPLVPGDLATIPGALLTAARLVPHPAASIVRSAFPIGSIWEAHRQDDVEPVTAMRAETILIVRPSLDVNIHILPAADAGFAESLLAQEPLTAAAIKATATDPAFDFGTALVGLISLGAFAAIRFEGEH